MATRKQSCAKNVWTWKWYSRSVMLYKIRDIYKGDFYLCSSKLWQNNSLQSSFNCKAKKREEKTKQLLELFSSYTPLPPPMLPWSWGKKICQGWSTKYLQEQMMASMQAVEGPSKNNSREQVVLLCCCCCCCCCCFFIHGCWQNPFCHSNTVWIPPSLSLSHKQPTCWEKKQRKHTDSVLLLLAMRRR